MRHLICLMLLMVITSGCAKDIVYYNAHYHKLTPSPDHSTGIYVVPYPMPEPPVPMPVPNPYPPEPLEADPWCMLPGIRRV